ncbi:MAG: hypothetical protein JSS72_00730 [Armatimonadetes bacterium]|nr:hypothetical protein [Armatimonadota bacterium]
MKPLEQRADVAYMQALNCVSYRMPRQGPFRPAGYLLALALRYGLVGAAATQHLLLSADADEENGVFSIAQGWPEAVEEHIRQFIAEQLPFQASASVPPLIGQLAYQPVGVALRLYRHFCPLDRCLEAAAEQFAIDHKRVLLQGVPFFQRPRVMRAFRQVTADSVRYALNFFDRRQYEIEEVSAIALIGE